MIGTSRKNFRSMSTHPHHSAVAVEPIEKGGSGRKFWRLHAGGPSLILVRYGEDRPENKHYVAIARFLAGVGVRVPVIHFHDESEGLILMEDAGDTDLWSFRAAPWRVRRALYQRTLDQALILHTQAHADPGAATLQILQPFLGLAAMDSAQRSDRYGKPCGGDRQSAQPCHSAGQSDGDDFRDSFGEREH